MEKREESLREALAKNNEECERWKTYKTENENAIENLQEFSKHLTVDVMVPIGRKCFMPGQLVHTNEVLVGHYQGYFSKCTAYKAKEICNLRVNRAKDQLKKLETEAELWTNKLKIPHMEGVVPSSEEREIIEDYDEEHEKRWREEHKKNLRIAKLKEKRKREEIQRLEEPKETVNTENSDEDIFKMLEEAELMEELEKELDHLEIEEVNDDILKKLMTENMESTKPKERIAHNLDKDKTSASKASLLDGVVKKNTPEFLNVAKSSATNNNNRMNPDIHANGDDDEPSDEQDDISEEVRVIKNQAIFLPANDQIGFYEYQVEIVRKKINSLKMINEQDIEEKLHLLTVLEELEDLLALAEEETLEMDSESESINNETIDVIKADKIDELKTEIKKPEKRHIKFALEDDTLLFRNNERVSQMLPKSLKSQKRKKDIITLDDDVLINRKPNEDEDFKAAAKTIDKKEQIRNKVEQSMEYVTNNQSKTDCDLITKIIDENESMNRTIYIAFKHSTKEPAPSSQTCSPFVEDNETEFVPEKPSDFYDLYLKQSQKQSAENNIKPKNIYVNSYIGEDEVKAPILRESNHKASYEDPRSTYSLPKSRKKEASNTKTTKPILRNKSAVERETHIDESGAVANNKSAKKKRFSFNEDDDIMFAYNKVMNEVVEKPVSEPEPLPEVQYIDAHAPKKRVSRFKQSRIGNNAE